MLSQAVPAESFPPSKDGITRRSSGAANGVRDGLQSVSRVVRVPLVRPDDAGWRDLVALAREAAAFANGMMAAWWAEAHGWRPPEDESAFRAFKGRLSGDVRVAVQAEARAVWLRNRARVMRRDQRLPAFASDRALCVRGKYSCGAGGVHIVREGAIVRMHLRLLGVAHGDATTMEIYWPGVRKDRYLSALLDHIAGGEYRCSKVTLQLDLRRRKLYALCAYDRPIPDVRSGQHVATLGPLEADGSLLLRSVRATRDYTREIYRIREMKTDYEGILKRFRRSVGRGPRWRQVYRRNMPATYSAWARAQMHQLSADIIQWCQDQQVDRLTIAPLADGDWPAHELETMLCYKAQHAGIVVAAADLDDAATERAARGPARKAQRQAGKTRAAVRVLDDALREEP